MTTAPFTRRRILAAVGSVGALYLGVDRVGAALGSETVETNQQTVNGTYAQSTEFTNAPPRIALAWRETVNGAVQEETDLAADGETGAVGLVVDEAVVPGDSGAVTMRARLLEDPEQTTQNARLYLRFRLSETAENGINDPERVAGDGTPDAGELDDVAEIRIWKDDGAFGSGDGEPTWADVPIVGDTEITDGWQSLAEVADSGTFDGGTSCRPVSTRRRSRRCTSRSGGRFRSRCRPTRPGPTSTSSRAIRRRFRWESIRGRVPDRGDNDGKTDG
ncbi:hypothetical protein ACFQJD_04690 [Haloplanus sp. GCM10025708]|uniref:hypothetical protein n=1 Tax=Haloplanus sp. GCM10025708 TaxID=3252679 RepID=UPI00360D2C05